ncbi:TPA: hypothetical protein NJH56_003052 [Pseudomonas aeruginosa]|nr:hypothetical protein [Pseudomonas aeruginosa]HCG0887211.1 hypothetical protein [Pseudomonas aeruginosa]
MGDTLSTARGHYQKVASMQSTVRKDAAPKPVAVDAGLTVFLGGAGMVGDYNEDIVASLTESGIGNAVYGNYSSLLEGLDVAADLEGKQVTGRCAFVAVVVTNLDQTEEVFLLGIGFAIGAVGELAVFRHDRVAFVLVVEHHRTGVAQGVQDTGNVLVQALKKSDFSLSCIGVGKPLPTIGQFNLIGYSWGAVIAARSAMFHARNGVRVDHLALIGAPINRSLVEAVRNHPKIGKVLIIDLKDKGDPIYAGMTDQEIVEAAATLGQQMLKGEGHFYYSGSDAEGQKRHRELARRLYGEGIR